MTGEGRRGAQQRPRLPLDHLDERRVVGRSQARSPARTRADDTRLREFQELRFGEQPIWRLHDRTGGAVVLSPVPRRPVMSNVAQSGSSMAAPGSRATGASGRSRPATNPHAIGGGPRCRPVVVHVVISPVVNVDASCAVVRDTPSPRLNSRSSANRRDRSAAPSR
jgi:hypothetical protein